MLSLEFGARGAVVAWADEVLASNPDHRVIVHTHAYLTRSSARYFNAIGGQQYIPDDYGIATTDAAVGINDGQELWGKLFSRHNNVIMVTNGHDLRDGAGHLISVGEPGQ